MSEQWRVIDHNSGWCHVVDDDGEVIAKVSGREVADQVAALPQLLAALKIANRATPITSPAKLWIANALARAEGRPTQ